MPVEVDLVTNLSVITNKRAYFFTLYSSKEKFNPYVRFTYSKDKNLFYDKFNKMVEAQNKAIATTESNEVTSSQNDEAFNTLRDIDFNYVMSKTDYAFAPVLVYSDLKQTVIEFKETLTETPVLVMLDKDGNPEVVRYRQEGNKMIVDKKIYEANLILGNEKIEIKHK